MNYFYDTSTKENCNISYELFIQTSLAKLGFKFNTLGTIYLKDLILFIYTNNVYDVCIDKLCKEFLVNKNIYNISVKNFITRIDYSIQNVDNKKFQYNFYNIFNVNYDIYYRSVKNIINLFICILNNIKSSRE